MVEEHYGIVWDKQALDQFAEVLFCIRKDSLQNADSVKKKLIQMTAALATNPFRYNADKFRKDRNASFRAFEIYNLRVSYFIDEQRKIIRIVRLRSTRRKPSSY